MTCIHPHTTYTPPQAEHALLGVSHDRDHVRLQLEAERRAATMHADRLDVLQGELQARDERITSLERQVWMVG